MSSSKKRGCFTAARNSFLFLFCNKLKIKTNCRINIYIEGIIKVVFIALSEKMANDASGRKKELVFELKLCVGESDGSKTEGRC